MQGNPITERHLNVTTHGYTEIGWASVRQRATEEIHSRAHRRRKTKPEHIWSDYQVGDFLVVDQKKTNGFMSEFLVEIIESRPFIKDFDSWYHSEKNYGKVLGRIVHSEHIGYKNLENIIVEVSLHEGSFLRWHDRFRYSSTSIDEYLKRNNL